MVTLNTTLKEAAENPCLAGWEHMVIPGNMESLVPALKGRHFAEMEIGDYRSFLPDWDPCAVAEGLNYLLERAAAGRVFYPIWEKQETEKDETKRKTGLTAFTTDKKSRFVIICPGGAYLSVCAVQEGFALAKRMNELGYGAFVLQYRVGETGGFPNPMEDLAQAVRFILDHEKEFNIRGDHYGIMGFSAGGHLAACFGTEDAGYGKYGIPRPGILILGYPQIFMSRDIAERAGMSPYILKDCSEEEVQQYSVEKHITDQYPPVFLWQCEDDPAVPAANTRALALELKKKRISYKYEVFPAAGHGWGLAEGTVAQGWLERAVGFWEHEQSDADNGDGI